MCQFLQGLYSTVAEYGECVPYSSYSYRRRIKSYVLLVECILCIACHMADWHVGFVFVIFQSTLIDLEVTGDDKDAVRDIQM